MQIELQFKLYKSCLIRASNQPLSLDLLLEPFEIYGLQSVPSNTILVGHLLDSLLEDYDDDAIVDVIDVLVAAGDLGLPAAEQFLDLPAFQQAQILYALA